jgi:hypothetical protein
MKEEAAMSRWERGMRATKGLRRLLFVVIVYATLRTVFADMAEGGGLLRVGGTVSWAFVGLGIVVMGMRGIVLFVVPGAMAYWVVARGLKRGL